MGVRLDGIQVKMVKLTFDVVFTLCLIVLFHHADAVKDKQQAPRGHLQQIGHHRDPEGHVDIITEPLSAQEFWLKYVSKRRPVLLRGAANEFPAKKLWMDHSLADTYGNLTVKIERKYEAADNPVGDMGLARDSIHNFIKTYVRDDKYVISQLPKPMYGDILVPPCLSCGSFNESIIEVNFWLSSGGTKSLLHKDAPNILNCLLNGTKNWIMISPKYEYMVPLAKEPSLAGGGYSVLDVDKIDLIKYPRFKDCPYHYANVTAGDCLYVPYGSLHHVRSFGEKNMAVSFLFSRTITHDKEFNSKGCEKQKFENLKDAPVAWDFDGVGSLTMGLNEPIFYRKNILKAFRDKTNITTKLFMKRLRDYMLPDKEEKSNKIHAMIMDKFHLHNKKYVTKEELLALPLDTYKQIIYNLELDPSNTLKYEYYQFPQSLVRRAIAEAVIPNGGIDREIFLENYQENVGGSEKIGKEVLQKLDVDGDGKISKAEKKAKLKEVLNLFENDMPPEHANDYQDVYVYRKKRDEVPEEDEMEYHFDNSHRPIDDGEGHRVDPDGLKHNKLDDEPDNEADNEPDDERDNDRPDVEEDEESEEIIHQEL